MINALFQTWGGRLLYIHVKGREAPHWGCLHGEGIHWIRWHQPVKHQACAHGAFSSHSTSGQPYIILTFLWIKPSEGGRRRIWEWGTCCRFCCDISHTSYLSSKCSCSLILCDFCVMWKPHSLQKQALLVHHASTETLDGCWSNSSWLNKGLLWRSGVPTLQILQRCSGDFVQLKGLVCWCGAFHCSCFFCSHILWDPLRSQPFITDRRCQPSLRTNEPAPGMHKQANSSCLNAGLKSLSPSRCPHGSSPGSPCET